MVQGAQPHSKGFTLTELVVVIVIAGILSAVAFARISTRGFDQEGFSNRAAAMVRYAQKLAIGQRRTIFVEAAGNTLRLCYTNTDCNAGCTTAVQEPPGTNAFSFPAPSGVTIADASFCFDTQGRPSAATALSITAAGETARTITIEADSGYVH